jgi:hypothetical protein
MYMSKLSHLGLYTKIKMCLRNDNPSYMQHSHPINMNLNYLNHNIKSTQPKLFMFFNFLKLQLESRNYHKKHGFSYSTNQLTNSTKQQD